MNQLKVTLASMFGICNFDKCSTIRSDTFHKCIEKYNKCMDNYVLYILNLKN